MEIVIHRDGTGRCIYGEALSLLQLGRIEIRRASHVEPTTAGQWQADLSPVGGPLLGPYVNRTSALAAETEWLLANWLTPNE